MRYKLVVVVLASLISMPAFAARPDSWVTTKTKLALWTTSGIHSTEINVDTIDGAVTLSGRVESADERAAAERETKKVEGVKSVRNLLQVVPATREKAVARDDKTIKKAAEEALRSVEGLSNVRVKSVNAGVVLLSGRVDRLADQERALRAVHGVSGVQRVASEIEGGDKGYAERDSDEKGTLKGGGRGASDSWVTTEVKMRLLADDKVPALDINVDTHDGIVSLFGTVPTEAAKAAAETQARKVDGVQRVTNDLQVVPESKKEIVKSEDKDIERTVKNAMAAREDLKDVDVMVKGGVVRLTGTVNSRMQKLQAQQVSRGQPGVRSVANELTIKEKKD